MSYIFFASLLISSLLIAGFFELLSTKKKPPRNGIGLKSFNSGIKWGINVALRYNPSFSPLDEFWDNLDARRLSMYFCGHWNEFSCWGSKLVQVQERAPTLGRSRGETFCCRGNTYMSFFVTDTLRNLLNPWPSRYLYWFPRYTLYNSTVEKFFTLLSRRNYLFYVKKLQELFQRQDFR